ncbi:MAG: sulfatase-like hydrolase/transferase [Bryobacterales bacterium]
MLVRWLLAFALALPLLAADKPNVILIFADDQGTVDAEGFGAQDLYTPNLRKLGDRGVRFSQFYVGAPVCSPSRAAMLTGRTPFRAGVPGNVPINGLGMPDEQFTIAEMLKSNGYATGIVGKWHLGEVNGGGPLDQGFDIFFGHKRGCIDNYSHFFYWSGPNVHDLWRGAEEVWEDGHYFSDLMLREAKRLHLRQPRPAHFFLYLPTSALPLQAEQEWRDYYRPALESKQMPENRFHYASLVSTLDEKVGEVLATVERLGLTDNTLIIFMSDHGLHPKNAPCSAAAAPALPRREVQPVRGRHSRRLDGRCPASSPRRDARPVRNFDGLDADPGRAHRASLPEGHKIDTARA